ncbi:hypothetical protein C1637_13575 [Chryseobacterium lactis]|uniref:Uncharacterized protein n=1 Tax=Chryseobacterium lactis TaxID=1241981 RepID=A0A3G6RM17_CHRLC|nr:hypothetical protein EG342_18990 [Chryseobacterium lactis]AZB04229.1 hypothetical protein EG341_09865 [Chryseobacterium lactis]PNW12863.1 hypothetical protein C1637_13575 [Chryseobacterium lactis]
MFFQFVLRKVKPFIPNSKFRALIMQKAIKKDKKIQLHYIYSNKNFYLTIFLQFKKGLIQPIKIIFHIFKFLI